MIQIINLILQTVAINKTFEFCWNKKYKWTKTWFGTSVDLLLGTCKCWPLKLKMGNHILLPKTLHNIIDYLQHSSLRIYFTRNHDCNVQCHFELSFPPPKILLLSGVINRHCEEPPNCNCLPVRQEWNRKFKQKQQCGLRERPGPQLLDAKSLLLSYWVKLKAQKWNYLLSICFFYY